MITRKIAREVFEIAFKDEIAHLHQKHIELMLNKFTDEPTPDEMLEEMREWAIKNKALYFYDENQYKNRISIQLNHIYVYKHCEGRSEAITEAYRQWKEATK